MFEKFLEVINKKDKKIENLIFLLIVLIVTLIVINCIMKDDNENQDEKYKGAVLASTAEVLENDLESRIESILSKINGVGKVSVLLTYDNEKLEGIVVVAEGSNDIETKINIISAVEAVTGLGKHKIKVYEMQMKGDTYGEENQYRES